MSVADCKSSVELVTASHAGKRQNRNFLLKPLSCCQKQAEQNYLRQTVFEMRSQGQKKAQWKIHKDTLPQGQT